jgi:hypothetical protein
MVTSKRELFENARKRWPEGVRILQTQPDINNCVHTAPPLYKIVEKIQKSIDFNDNWSQISVWSFHQAADKLGRRKYKQLERNLTFKDVSFMSFNTMMMRNLTEDKFRDDWKEERERYMELDFEQDPEFGITVTGASPPK